MAIELTTLIGVSPAGLDWEETTYHGKPVGDIFMDEGDEGNCQHLYDLMEQEPDADGFVQDCYLGYVPGRDIFIVGYDLNRGGGYHRVKTTPEGRITEVRTLTWATKQFYDDLYDRVKDQYPGLIDLRLD